MDQGFYFMWASKLLKSRDHEEDKGRDKWEFILCQYALPRKFGINRKLCLEVMETVYWPMNRIKENQEFNKWSLYCIQIRY